MVTNVHWGKPNKLLSSSSAVTENSASTPLIVGDSNAAIPSVTLSGKERPLTDTLVDKVVELQSFYRSGPHIVSGLSGVVPSGEIDIELAGPFERLNREMIIPAFISATPMALLNYLLEINRIYTSPLPANVYVRYPLYGHKYDTISGAQVDSEHSIKFENWEWTNGRNRSASTGEIYGVPVTNKMQSPRVFPLESYTHSGTTKQFWNLPYYGAYAEATQAPNLYQGSPVIDIRYKTLVPGDLSEVVIADIAEVDETKTTTVDPELSSPTGKTVTHTVSFWARATTVCWVGMEVLFQRQHSERGVEYVSVYNAKTQGGKSLKLTTNWQKITASVDLFYRDTGSDRYYPYDVSANPIRIMLTQTNRPGDPNFPLPPMQPGTNIQISKPMHVYGTDLPYADGDTPDELSTTEWLAQPSRDGVLETFIKMNEIIVHEGDIGTGIKFELGASSFPETSTLEFELTTFFVPTPANTAMVTRRLWFGTSNMLEFSFSTLNDSKVQLDIDWHTREGGVLVLKHKLARYVSDIALPNSGQQATFKIVLSINPSFIGVTVDGLYGFNWIPDYVAASSWYDTHSIAFNTEIILINLNVSPALPEGASTGIRLFQVHGNEAVETQKPPVVNPVEIEETLRTSTVNSDIPGGKYNAWQALNDYLSANKVRAVYRGNILVIENTSSILNNLVYQTQDYREETRAGDSYSLDKNDITEKIIVNYKDSVAASNFLLWKADSIISLDRGERYEERITIPHSITSLNQPVQVTEIDPLPYESGSGQYVVWGNDGYVVPINFWQEEGGQLTVEVDPDDPNIIILRILAPNVESAKAPYTISEGKHQPALYITGTGIKVEENSYACETGLEAPGSPEVTIDNPFITSIEQAQEVFIDASVRHAPRQTLESSYKDLGYSPSVVANHSAFIDVRTSLSASNTSQSVRVSRLPYNTIEWVERAWFNAGIRTYQDLTNISEKYGITLGDITYFPLLPIYLLDLEKKGLL